MKISSEAPEAGPIDRSGFSGFQFLVVAPTPSFFSIAVFESFVLP